MNLVLSSVSKILAVSHSRQEVKRNFDKGNMDEAKGRP
ncbi:hypothetical protein T01_173 [Trichinella spiralis]|uniref:Uncharacterized protein n=1 Tax=Trichinella spiralis TaxID=6334 RepID=A0A0V1AH53_TRISP|nr:hypothetical protein T01_173 [Trichinella spiralis]